MKPINPADLSVLDVLRLARSEFAFHGGCTTTDRPDLPLSPETAWTVDFSQVIAAIDGAVSKLVGDADRTDRECVRCSTCRPIAPEQGPAISEPEHQGSRTPFGDRS